MKLPELTCDASRKQNEGSSDNDDSEEFVKIVSLESVIESLQSVGEPFIKKTTLVKGEYPTRKVKELKCYKIKEKFQDLLSPGSLKMIILIVSAESVAILRVQEVFLCASNMTVRPKQLIMDHGNMPSHIPKPDKTLNRVNTEAVKVL
jgi:hypothetical protein